MERICITCKQRKNIQEFNDEHIIPSAIGGVLVIKSVCEKCNSILGKSVDSAFVNNNGILFYRNRFKISRNENKRKKHIPNPFDKVYKDKDGNQHTIEFVDGEITAKSIEKVEIFGTEHPNTFIAKLTIPAEKKEDAELILDKLLKRKKINAQFFGDKTESKSESGSDIELDLNFKHSSVILGSIKIAYELAATLFPSYLNDEYSSKYITYMFQPEENKNLIPLINKASTEIFKRYSDRLSELRIINSCHAVLFENIVGYGFVCCVKIFEMILPFYLSDKEYIFPTGQREIVILNDSVSLKYHSNISTKYLKRNFNVELDHLPKEMIVSTLMQGEQAFYNKSNYTPVYNRNGKEIFKDLFYLCEYMQRINGLTLNLEQKKQLCVFGDDFEYYLKISDQTLVRLTALEFTKVIELFDIQNHKA